MPTRTIVEDFCDVCFIEQKEKETEAADKLRFAWQGRDYILLVCAKHVGPIRDELQRLSELATPEATKRRSPGATRPTRAGGGSEPSKTLFSQLTDEEKTSFRIWADMPNARRIGDARVQEWIEAGKP